MPHSLVINLLPLSPIPVKYLTGNHLHAMFLTLVSNVNQELGDRLHQSQSHKPFTVSPLQYNSREGFLLYWRYNKPIFAGKSCWWRISLLDDALFSELTPLWLNQTGQKLRLGSTELQITSILGTPQLNQPWANATKYEQLYSEASESDRNLVLLFATPTVFGQGKYNSAMPTPELVFQSLLNKWNKYSNIPFSADILATIFFSYFKLETQVFSHENKNLIGCIGKIKFRIFEEIKPIYIKQINTLVDFALYCGVGKKTTMGMGMVRRELNDSGEKNE